MNKINCVINSKHIYITFVNMYENTPLGYELKKDECLIDTLPPEEKFLKNKWTGKGWVLDMTEDEAKNERTKYYTNSGIKYPLKKPTNKENILENAVFELAEELALKDEEIQELKQGQEETNEALFELAEMMGG